MALASLADVKQQLDIPTSDTKQDSRLTLYINAATQAIETYCGRSFDVATRTEYHDGDLSNAILSKQWPIISISELWVDPTRAFTDTTYQLTAPDYLIQGESRITFTSMITPRVSGSIKLVYSAGYSTTPLISTLPAFGLSNGSNIIEIGRIWVAPMQVRAMKVSEFWPKLQK